MRFQKEYFLSQLLSLKPTEEHLRALAMYCRTFNQDWNTIMEGITYCHLNSSVHHRLIIYYLINEILVSEKDTSNPFTIGLKSFIRNYYENDLKSSRGLEVIHKKFTDLEKYWISKGIINSKDEVFTLEDIVDGIQESFDDKELLVEYLEGLLEYYKSRA